MKKTKHLMCVPFTGLGRYNGFRGNRWLKNRIKVFEQFVVPSLLSQTSQDFILWVAWRREEKCNKQVIELKKRLEEKFNVVFTYSGVPFWDDKYPDDVAKVRLIDTLHNAMGDLINTLGECDDIIMQIQPSDDCYCTNNILNVKNFFEHNDYDVYGYGKGYIMDYKTGEIREYNPETTPPFYAIKFDRETFIDPLKHIKFTGPYKSHEYVKDYLKCYYSEQRGFLVGTHGCNISTVFDHPYAKDEVPEEVLGDFGINNSGKLDIKFNLRNKLFNKLPYKAKRKLRYWSENFKIFEIIYNWLRS